MQIAPIGLGFSVADGEHVELTFRDGDLVLRFIDWREQPVEHCFVDAIGFRWSTHASVETPRDDTTYQVLDSAWLTDEVRSEGYEIGDFGHYVLCFNAEKVLEVLSRLVPNP